MISMLEPNNLTLAYLVSELSVIEGGYFNKVQQVNKNLFKFRLHTSQGSLSLASNQHAIWISSYSVQATHNPQQFIRSLDSMLSNKRILKVRQHKLDRIIVFEFEDYSLIFEFFRDSNIILVDKEMVIVGCLKKQSWSDRQIKTRETYHFPKSKGENPLEIDFGNFKEFFRTENKAVVALILALNIAPVLAEEIFERKGFSKTDKASALSDKQLKDLFNEMKELYSLKQESGAYVKGEQLLPFEISGSEKMGDNLMQAMDNFYMPEFADSEKRKAETRKEKGITGLKASIDKQVRTKEQLEKKVEDNKRKAELIYENFTALQELESAVKAALEKKYARKEIMYKLEEAASQGSRSASLIKDIDLKGKKIVVEL